LEKDYIINLLDSFQNNFKNNIDTLKNEINASETVDVKNIKKYIKNLTDKYIDMLNNIAENKQISIEYFSKPELKQFIKDITGCKNVEVTIFTDKNKVVALVNSDNDLNFDICRSYIKSISSDLDFEMIKV
jgi:hypothetical protein